MKLTFAGGADTVTGSNFLVENSKGRILIDCGLLQGHDFAEKLMYAPFPYDVPSLDALVITHAHLDHIGRCPKLMRSSVAGVAYTFPLKPSLMSFGQRPMWSKWA